MASLAEIRAKLQKQENRQGQSQDNTIYPHWQIPDDSTAIVRFTEDADPNNDYFWVERLMIKIPFTGVEGDPESKPVTVQVPCMEMWKEACPVLTEIRPWFKDSSLEDIARKYWKKKSYLFQGFVREDPLKEENAPENPIRRFIMSPQLFKIIKGILLDPETEELPTDPKRGLDFRISKAKQGQYSDYNTSNWARRESALTDEELEAIEKYGLYDLKEFLPKKPNDVEVKVIKEMFEASVDGALYDPKKWGEYFKPPGLNVDSAKSSTPTPTKTESVAKSTNDERPVDDEDVDNSIDHDEDVDNSVDSVEPTQSTSKAQDILAKIKARKSA